MPGIILEEVHQHYSEHSQIFTSKEKEKIKSVNSMLKKAGTFDFNLGLMIAFYFTIPNNSMPMFWKDGYSYTDRNGTTKEWKAILPRRF